MQKSTSIPKLAIITLVSSLFILFNSCKERTILGADLIPAIDNINTFFTDTISMVTKNITLDSANTSTTAASNRYFALGVIDGSAAADNIFGKTVANIALQFRQPQTQLSLASTLAADSLVLSIPFIRTYGDTASNKLQSFDVYRLEDAMLKTKNYYSNSKLSYSTANKLGTTTINLNKMDSVQVKGSKLAPQLRIKLDIALAQELLALKDTLTYKTYDSFLNWFKGLIIVPTDTNSGNMIGYFDQIGAKLDLYTHNTDVTKKDTITYTFPFDDRYCAMANLINRNFFENSPLISNYINSGNDKGDSLLFLNSNLGSTIEVSFPYLANFNKVMVNKAELEFTIITSGNTLKDSVYRPIAQLIAYGLDDSTKDYVLLKDYYLTTTGNVTKLINDGFRKVEDVNGKSVYKYRITLTRSIQEAILTKNAKFKIRLVGNNGLLASGRSLMGGASKSSFNAKFNLIYTKIK
jgi:hypothetical protein